MNQRYNSLHDDLVAVIENKMKSRLDFPIQFDEMIIDLKNDQLYVTKTKSALLVDTKVETLLRIWNEFCNV